MYVPSSRLEWNLNVPIDLLSSSSQYFYSPGAIRLRLKTILSTSKNFCRRSQQILKIQVISARFHVSCHVHFRDGALKHTLPYILQQANGQTSAGQQCFIAHFHLYSDTQTLHNVKECLYLCWLYLNIKYEHFLQLSGRENAFSRVFLRAAHASIRLGYVSECTKYKVL